MYNVRVKKFCNNKCSNIYNNSLRRRKQSVCKTCGKEFDRYKTDAGRWSWSKNCQKCQESGYGNSITFLNKTKSQVYQENKTKQSARNAICGNAKIVYKHSSKVYKCVVCGYDLHVDICHLRAVSDFSDDTKIEVINDINNLVALCPNHHWELDNKKLEYFKEPQCDQAHHI